ncbi:class I SAM-dependent methyltransferase [Brevibacterium album]|uniref:class I SAM-dependent methyltransferase n=1 Tax=Brevibacterium album TaxID=417948 RepID=UPI00041A0088|nr:class I SAM-dependent methyltransferase [Brevibacterium album]
MSAGGAEAFTGLGEVYSRARPGYPEACYALLEQAVGGSGAAAGDAAGSERDAAEAGAAVVADIGAGTGKLTAGLLERGWQVTAVEPNPDMLGQLEAHLGGRPGLRTLQMPAESTSLADGSVDLVTVAQAFHWFDARAFREECRRILAPGGQVAIIWNFRRAEEPSIRQTVEAFREHASGFVALTLGETVTQEDLAEFFGPGGCSHAVFDNDEDLDRETYLGRYLSTSYFPKEGDPGRAPLIAELERIFDEHSTDGVYRFPNATHVYLGSLS